jgi:catechol-2,3-dioxygenase
VPDEETLAKCKARIESHGVEVLGPVDHGMCRSIYFFDPNGHRLELAVDTMTRDMRQRLGSVSGEMLEEWSRTKKAPRHADWVHRE